MELMVGERRIAYGETHVDLRRLVGCYELVFTFRLTVVDARRGQSRASVAGARIVVASAQGEAALGFARPEQPFEVACAAYVAQQTSSLHLDLQPTQLAALESLRDTGDMAFEIAAMGVGVDKGSETHLVGRGRVTVPCSEWIGKLRDAGARNILLLEVPMPLDDPSEGWQPIVASLQRAEELYVPGDYRGCIAACRETVEELGHHSFGDDWHRGALGRLSAGHRSMTKPEREQALYAVLRHYAHQAHHMVSEGGEAVYTRPEAQLALRITAAAVAHAQGR